MNRAKKCRTYLCPAVVLVGLVLSACGPVTEPTSEATVSATPTAGPTTAGDGTSTLIRSASPTAAFLDRARVVAQAVRAAGIPEPPAGIFLRSSRTPGLAFDTTEQKLAWTSGKVAIAPAVQLGSSGTTRIDFADGSSLPVKVLDARPALTAAIGTTNDNCRNMPASSCTLTITGASLGTAKVVTSNGPATVPAWSFTVKNLSRAMVVVAVSDEVLKTPVEPVPPPGLAKLEPGLLQVGTLTRIEGSTLTYILQHGMCEPDLQAQVLEFEDLVIIGGSHGPVPAGACGADVGRQTTAIVTLATPLGDRAVISASTGVRLTPLN